MGDQPHWRMLGVHARDHDQLTGAWLYRSDQGAVTKHLKARLEREGELPVCLRAVGV